MQKHEYFFEGLCADECLLKLTDTNDVLYFDIETTGLSKLKNHIYLIGCGFYLDGGFKIVQFFCEKNEEEALILKSFRDFSSSFNTLVHFNGSSFDIPFILARFKKYGMEFNLSEFMSIDLYSHVKPYKNFLGLSNLKQKTIERFLGIKRKDEYSGNELINVYKEYVKINDTASLPTQSCNTLSHNYLKKDINKNARIESILSSLLLHNMEDVKNMHYITKILEYERIRDVKISYDNYFIKNYTDLDGLNKQELIITGTHGLTIPNGFSNLKNLNCGILMVNFSSDGKVSVRIPIKSDTLNYYLPDYKNYYYLKNENMCILKSMAGGVLKENRENATKENCCVRLNADFVPVFNKKIMSTVKTFRETYKSAENYMRLEDFKNLTESDISDYLNLALLLPFGK